MLTLSEDLRPIEYEQIEGGEKLKGWFHRWIQKTDEEGDEYVVALVEDERGAMSYANCESVVFTDREALLSQPIF